MRLKLFSFFQRENPAPQPDGMPVYWGILPNGWECRKLPGARIIFNPKRSDLPGTLRVETTRAPVAISISNYDTIERLDTATGFWKTVIA